MADFAVSFPDLAAAGPEAPSPPAEPAPAAAAGRPIPGLDTFDRLELSSGPALSQAYAKFTVHPDSGEVSIKILDARTDEIIREIPPDEVIRLAEQLQAYLQARSQARARRR